MQYFRYSILGCDIFLESDQMIYVIFRKTIKLNKKTYGLERWLSS